MQNKAHSSVVGDFRVWADVLFFAWSDNLNQYRRTFLGSLWAIIGLGIGSIGLGLVWSQLWNQPIEIILPRITIGFLIWYFIAGCITEGTGCIINNAIAINNNTLPLCFYPMLAFVKQVVKFGYSLILIIGLHIVLPLNSYEYIPYILLGFLINCWFLYVFMYFVGIMAARFRDLVPLILSTLPIVFFVSPVLFRPQQMGELAWLIWLNPLTYFITVLRDPLTGAPPQYFVILISIFMCSTVNAALLIVLKLKKSQIVFWA